MLVRLSCLRYKLRSPTRRGSDLARKLWRTRDTTSANNSWTSFQRHCTTIRNKVPSLKETVLARIWRRVSSKRTRCINIPVKMTSIALHDYLDWHLLLGGVYSRHVILVHHANTKSDNTVDFSSVYLPWWVYFTIKSFNQMKYLSSNVCLGVFPPFYIKLSCFLKRNFHAFVTFLFRETRHGITRYLF